HKEKAKILLGKKESKTMVYWHIFQAHNLNPLDSEANRMLEDLKASLGESRSARDPIVERLEEKWRQNPENFNVLIQLGKIYRSRKDYLNLLKIYNRLERLNIKDPYLKGQIQSLVIPEEQKPPAPLQEIKKEPFNPLKAIPLWAYIILGLLIGIFLINKIITKGQEKAQEATQTVSQEMDNIISTFEQNIKELDFNIKPFLKMEREGNLKGALEGYNALISEKPNHPKVYILYGRAGLCALKVADYRQAVENLKAAYSKSPEREKKKYLIPLSQAYIKNGQNFEAEMILKEGIEMKDEEISPECLFIRAELYLKQGKRNSAKDDLEAIEKDYPNSSFLEKAKNLKNSYSLE
ncbi:MAG: tetratricopeptide repeat protein, partial [Thermoanaerobaculia bacterium]